jgi:hypothetical protein
MKTKLSGSIFVLLFISILSFGQQNHATNALPGAENFYKDLFGTNVEANRSALDAVVFIDFSNGNDFVLPALTDAGYNVTVALNWGDFNTKLLSGSYGLAVGFSQNFWSVPSAAAIQTFINNGGSMIFCDWTRDASLAGLFNASYTLHVNQTPVNIIDPTYGHLLTNPLALTNNGWGTWSMGMAATGGGQVLATFPNGDAAAIKGNGGRTIILGYLSDTPPSDERQQLFSNALDIINGREIPVSDWAIYFGILLMVSFIIYRGVKTY